jgi:phosphate transport system permease protein
VWVSGAALSAALLIALLLIGVVITNGVGVFWPAALTRFELADGSHVMGVALRTEERPGGAGQRIQVRVGNRELYGADFRWLDLDGVRRQEQPPDAVVLERREHGCFHGFLVGLGEVGPSPATPSGEADRRWREFLAAWEQVQTELGPVRDGQGSIDALNRQIEDTRLRLLRLRYHGGSATAERVLEARHAELSARFAKLTEAQAQAVSRVRAKCAVFVDASGTAKAMPLADIVRAWRPNGMGVPAKLRHYGAKLVELVLTEPREANTEGGLLPAIIGTVMMVFTMSVFSFPLGVLTAIYLREYAKDGLVVRLVRIAVNNLAGIPSIVYGVFGLGFFVYGVGGALDRIFFPERLPTPTFGTGGILWASLTLALLTVPVVIVATEESLAAIPRGIREGSLALGATRLQTLTRILVPMASPGILTGFILAMARAAGEVAPLMVTGVVKLAPSLPVDTHFPFLHLNRKFMHLGFHIYDIGFQSPNSEAAKPMVFVTTLLLVLIVLVLTGTAIRLRNRMRQRYTLGSF